MAKQVIPAEAGIQCKDDALHQDVLNGFQKFTQSTKSSVIKKNAFSEPGGSWSEKAVLFQKCGAWLLSSDGMIRVRFQGSGRVVPSQPRGSPSYWEP
ncbi:hypothetical protein SAMN05660653_01365 [Desulfonatronum thiosulfatophilum]|uniref:Uncharacterized protein n=1 Tax=Desulfonatronum thiosulfatophilum TaxID=617002 RepID=A0A1G6C711_9BACT|nr:hypothetical protein SAMN05660653_01365 [Desulfonatronum thiosulfatophilum]